MLSKSLPIILIFLTLVVSGCGREPSLDEQRIDPAINENFVETLPQYANAATQHEFLSGTIKLFHAKGTHECWSSEAIGYSCLVEDRIFTDCSQAFTILKRKNCCHDQYYDGVSNNFTLNFCTPFF